MTAPEDALTGGALDAWRIYLVDARRAYANGRCTCGGTAPGYPMHEDFCGKPEDTAEAKSQARDYDGWAAL